MLLSHFTILIIELGCNLFGLTYNVTNYFYFFVSNPSVLLIIMLISTDVLSMEINRFYALCCPNSRHGCKHKLQVFLIRDYVTLHVLKQTLYVFSL